MIDFIKAVFARFPWLAQVVRFILVGFTSSMIHFTTVVAIVQTFGTPPLLANIFGFMISFQASYWGHRLWTFSDTVVAHRVAFLKLLCVQIFNFSVNESLFYFFLTLHLPYPIALLIVLAILPFFTFVTSKFWVFR